MSLLHEIISLPTTTRLLLPRKPSVVDITQLILTETAGSRRQEKGSKQSQNLLLRAEPIALITPSCPPPNHFGYMSWSRLQRHINSPLASAYQAPSWRQPQPGFLFTRVKPGDTCDCPLSITVHPQLPPRPVAHIWRCSQNATF
jgi:hypothetical protein